MRRWVAVFFVVMFGMGLATGKVAAQSSIGDSADLISLVEQAKRDGVRIIVVEPGAKPSQKAASPPLILQAQEVVGEVKSRFLATLQAIPIYWSLSLKALQNGGGDRSLWWPLQAFAIAAFLLFVALFPARLLGSWAEKQLQTVFDPNPETSISKISYLYLRALSQFAAVSIQVGLALLAALAVEFEPWGYRITVYLVLFGWFTYRTLDIFFSNLLAIGAPERRLLALSNDRAASIYRGAVWVFAPMILVMVGCVWQEMLKMDHNAHLLSLIIATALSVALLSHFVITHRSTVAYLIRGEHSQYRPIWHQVFSSSWHLLALTYVAVAYAVLFARLLLGQPNAMLLAVAPMLAILGAIALFGAGLWLVEWLFEARSGSADDEEPDVSEPTTSPELDPLDGEGLLGADQDDQTEELPSYKGLFVSWARLFAWLVAGAWLLNMWGIAILSQDGTSAAVWKVLIIALLAYLSWGLIKVAFDRRIAEEGGDVQIIPGEIGGAAGSRLGTLLPLVRNFILILLSTIVAMMVLVEMGVNIGPIFAGAGIVGLAIGFGAQTLVKDIISGVFFLVDDAFRKGEYIDIGSVKGTVEKISIRSMQLRHHNGPLNTVPFGDIQHVTNYSRDWVVMKLPLRLTYDTDAEMVRKLIKKLGQEMQKDEVLGPMFLQPLKSQGVIQMEDSAMIMRVKFMTKPGDQWGIRRIVFARIRDLFEEKGIKFANREVTVRLADDIKPEETDSVTRKAAQGAAARIIQDKAPAPAIEPAAVD